MAGTQHTQTHPKFTWCFLGMNHHANKTKSCHLTGEDMTDLEVGSILTPPLTALPTSVEVHHG